MTQYRFHLWCPRCGKTSVAVVETKERNPRVKCGDCLMEHTEIVEMKVAGYEEVKPAATDIIKDKKPVSWKPEVQTDATGNWYGNALRFATKKEAEAQVRDLSMRWMLVRDTRVVESDDPVNYAYVNHDLWRIEQ